jgi:hypothetical protein
MFRGEGVCNRQLAVKRLDWSSGEQNSIDKTIFDVWVDFRKSG